MQGASAPKIGPLGGALGPFAAVSNTIFEEEMSEDAEVEEERCVRRPAASLVQGHT